MPYRKWSLRFLLYLIIANVVASILIVSEDTSLEAASHNWKLTVVSGLAFIFWLSGIVLTFISYFKKEGKNYQFVISAWGFALYTILAILVVLLLMSV